MQKFKYKKIDAFTSVNSLGNPAAYLYMDTVKLTSDKMLQIGREHKGFVSEFVFAEPSQTADIKLTYYSSECEVEFCGHGTIATMYDIIKNTPQLNTKKEILLETNKKGFLKVYNRLNEEDAVYITAPEPLYLDISLNKKDIAKALNISESTISQEYNVGFIDGGLRTLLVPITDYKDEISMYPDEQCLKKFCLTHNIDIVLVFCFKTSSAVNFVHTRVFSPKFGYLEDPATGSGNSALGYYMIKNKLWNGNPISIEQGGNNRIYNIVKILFNDGRIQFGGNAKTKIKGYYIID